jgi:phospholipid/cholesterol/gamma-HCH transport system permease protein
MATGTVTNAPEPESPAWLAPIGLIGWLVVGTLGHLGRTAALAASAAGSLVRPFDEDADEAEAPSAVSAELWWMLLAGFPLVGLVHIAMGSFLSLQAYFGSTFVDGTGAVVGVGLLRNLASMMTGLTLAGMLPARIVPELCEIRRRGASPAPGRLARPRLLAAVVATPLLSLWGVVVGMVVGWQSSGTLMGLPSETFFLMFSRMIWYRDVVGLLVKGALFGLFTASFACSEGLSAGDEGAQGHGAAMLRAACLSMTAILVINMTWFILVYHAVPVYGPSLLMPPTP